MHGTGPAPPDPGDLSRRLAARRAELRLSLSQVAERAAVNRRYLEYLENFPGQPDAGTLRRLAAALRTTPGALLGGDAPPGRRPGPVGRLEPLSLADCHRLLAPGGFGRLAFTTASGLMVLPVNYVLVAGTIVLRTGTGSLIAAHGDDQVSFETDHLDETLGAGWSVLVRGSGAPGAAARRAQAPAPRVRPAALARRRARPVRQDRARSRHRPTHPVAIGQAANAVSRSRPRRGTWPPARP